MLWVDTFTDHFTPQAGIAAVFTPKDYDLTTVMSRVLDVIRESKDLQPV